MQRKTNKIYRMEQSPLFEMQSKGKFAALMNASVAELKALRSDNDFRVFVSEKNGKSRPIQHPVGFRRYVHIKLFDILRRIELPEYVISGRKGFSQIDNAKAHRDSSFLYAMDIEKFYASSRKEYVLRFFKYKLGMSDDLSHFISDILCYDKMIPTGSAISQLLAYWAYSDVFDKIHEISVSRGMKFTLYVDDFTFSSSQPIPHSLVAEINGILKSVSLRLKRKKINYYSKKKSKLVTGIIITPDGEFRIPNGKRKGIIESFRAMEDEISEKGIKSIQGKVGSANQIEPGAFAATLRKYQTIKSKS